MAGFRELNSVEDTALDAANAKCSAVAQGYYTDPYIEYFVPGSVRQLPPMNLGYFVRCLAMWEAVASFLRVHGDVIQVVVLGGGYDTLFWRLRDMKINVARWYDLDLPHVVQRKLPVLRHELFEPLDNYYCLECDLARPGLVETTLAAHGFDPAAPTAFIDECTLIYVDPDAVDSIISFAASLASSGFISYGMVRPDDPFGRMMVQNFKSFGAPLKGIDKYPTVESHRARFTSAGYAKVKAVEMNAAMDAVLAGAESVRVRRLEMQDDPEELAFMLSHYVLAVASTDDAFLAILPQTIAHTSHEPFRLGMPGRAPGLPPRRRVARTGPRDPRQSGRLSPSSTNRETSDSRHCQECKPPRRRVPYPWTRLADAAPGGVCARARPVAAPRAK